MTTEKISTIDMLMLFARKQDLTNFTNSKIVYWKHGFTPFTGLKIVWNEGRGLIKIADFANDGVLVLNNLFMNKETKKQIKILLDTEKINYQFVDFVYPDYYAYDLAGYYTHLKETNQLTD